LLRFDGYKPAEATKKRTQRCDAEHAQRR